LIFTDGSPGIENDPQAAGFNVYRADFYDPGECAVRLPAELHKRINSCPEVSAAQVFGYDAVLFVHQPLQRCKEVSRKCLLEQLQNTPAFSGVCFPYSFRDGENAISSYYIFQSKNAQPGKSSRQPSSERISELDIIQFWSKVRSSGR